MRYAKALIEYAKEKHTEDVLYKEMKMLSKSLSAVPRLRGSFGKSCFEHSGEVFIDLYGSYR